MQPSLYSNHDCKLEAQHTVVLPPTPFAPLLIVDHAILRCHYFTGADARRRLGLLGTVVVVVVVVIFLFEEDGDGGSAFYKESTCWW